MTIEEIENNLPNGFHDAFLQKMEIDYEKQIVELEISIDLSNPESPTDELLGKVKLITTGVFFCAIEPPSGDFLQKKRGIMDF